MTETDSRFGGIARLYGVDALEKFSRAHVCVVGIGGVGSWIVEAL
ncbi:MAG: tRNA threonylcarbamoyladenosine dehydratase, partial [Akkermansiaceae bacterium]